MYKKIKDDDRESILMFVKEHKYNYSKPIPVEDVADILYDMQYVRWREYQRRLLWIFYPWKFEDSSGTI